MTHGITTIFISPWVETGEVVILDFLVFFGRIMKFYSIGSAAKETVTRIKSFLQIQLGNEYFYPTDFETGAPIRQSDRIQDF